MDEPKKNRAAAALGRRGGKAKSQAKIDAASKNLEAARLKRWPVKVEESDGKEK